MILAIGLVFIFRFSGGSVTIHYASTIFMESGSTIDPNVSTVIMGTLLIVGQLSATILMDIVGRKTLLMLSAAGGCISLLLTSTFTYLVVHGIDLTSYNSVPVVFLSIFKLSNSIGMGAIPPVMIPELLPRNVSTTKRFVSVFYINITRRFVNLELEFLCVCRVRLRFPFSFCFPFGSNGFNCTDVCGSLPEFPRLASCFFGLAYPRRKGKI